MSTGTWLSKRARSLHPGRGLRSGRTVSVAGLIPLQSPRESWNSWSVTPRGIAQPGRAPGLGPGSRRFDSGCPDQWKMTQRGAGPAWKAVGARKGVEFKSLVFRRRPRTRCRSQTRASIWIWKLNRRGAEPALNPVRSERAGVRVFRLPPREQKVPGR